MFRCRERRHLRYSEESGLSAPVTRVFSAYTSDIGVRAEMDSDAASQNRTLLKREKMLCGELLNSPPDFGSGLDADDAIDLASVF
jgi:hypothetical protein